MPNPSAPLHPGLTVLRQRAWGWVAAMGLGLCLGAQAQTVGLDKPKITPHEQVQQLMVQLKRVEALDKIEAYLQERPRDPQMRFWRARMQAELGRKEQALETYTLLTQDYPELPEPQNNLGVLYAARGELDKARAAFEQALRNNPQYATAQENLGDIWVLLAQQAYERAAQLEPGNRNILNKRTLLKPAVQLISVKP